jgi:hypothetical protein
MKTWLVLTVHDSIPIDDRYPNGGHYVAGGKWYYFPEDAAQAEIYRAALETKGYSASVASETR